MRAIFARRSSINLLGAHVDVVSGEWTHTDAAVGVFVDSLYEYLLKGWIAFGEDEDYLMFSELYKAVNKHLHKSGWFVEANMWNGKMTWPTFSALAGFWPSLQVLWGDLDMAHVTAASFYRLWTVHGLLPERFRLDLNQVEDANAGYWLRPELIESLVYLEQATGDTAWLSVGRDILSSIEASAYVPCGYAAIGDVRTHSKLDAMPSYFLAETVKYLYLLFDSPELPRSPPRARSQAPFARPSDHSLFSGDEQALRRSFANGLSEEQSTQFEMNNKWVQSLQRIRHKTPLVDHSLKALGVEAILGPRPPLMVSDHAPADREAMQRVDVAEERRQELHVKALGDWQRKERQRS